MQNTEGGGKYPKKFPPRTKCMEGEERGLSSGEPRHGVRRGRCIMLGVSNWAPISPPVLGRLLFLAAPLTIPVPAAAAAAFVDLVLGVVIVIGLLCPRHPLVPCCRCQQFVLIPKIIKMIRKKKQHTSGSKNAYDVLLGPFSLWYGTSRAFLLCSSYV